MNTKAFEEEIKHYDTDAVLIFENGESVYQYEQSPGNLQALHKINSVTKSILGLLIGIAIEKGHFPGIHEKVCEHVSDDRVHPSVTISQLLTLSGTNNPDAWWHYINEKTPFHELLDTYASNSREMRYNNTDSHILREILESSSQADPYEYIQENLFTYLDIKEADWIKDHLGKRIGGYGMYIKPADLMSIAELIRNKGIVNGIEIVSEEWIDDMTSPLTDAPQPNQSYGYHWWHSAFTGTQPEFVYAAGMQGNFAVIVPEQNRSIVICSSLERKNSLEPFHAMLKHLIK
ncbi:serine hydrolase domain-containing protein [Salisediminibacterium selenitireducens]|uniref:Beta-lactamase n=1 Tax=Bacillus selenitireducens (strain ATCC 700615 / DSM 15326 / MLS10) TaxID=439292 RepID=D6XUJ0_BACIE|nr:serine hydrolase [Salisediminibacterium selenitireducens]ADH99476.1 beta-lactamase [[Bacillus] selenitireducens MLS10]